MGPRTRRFVAMIGVLFFVAFWIWGAHARMAPDERVSLGFGVSRDENPAESLDLVSVDLSMAPLPGTPSQC